MKAVATALVLVVGAAIVLWFANTLNSWVLGGLIGGLAALLLSIPISLLLFSHLSRRHDEKLRAEIQEETRLAQEYEYPEIAQRSTQRGYPVERYDVYEEEVWEDDPYDEEEFDYSQQRRPARNLPPAPSYPQLPPARPKQTNRLSPNQHRMTSPTSKQLARQPHEKGGVGKQTTRLNYPGFPGYESSLSEHRSAALRAARREAVERFDDEMIEEELPTQRSKRSLPRPRRGAQHERLPSSPDYSSSHATPPKRPRRVVDAIPSRDDVRTPQFPPASNQTYHHGYRPQDEPETEYLENYPPSPTTQRPRTGQIARRRTVDMSPTQDTEGMTGNIQRPMLRRAPYLYDDDPLHEELSQQLDAPAVRRSSLQDHLASDDEESQWD